MFKKIFWFFFFISIIGIAAAAVFLTWGYYRISRDLPRLTNIEDYKPPAVSRVYANDGTLIAEFYTQRRYPIKAKDIPKRVINAFLAAEDANFFSHKGIDYTSILRAVYKNLQAGSSRQGASTITQQVVKNLILSSEKSYERKIKEAILSYRLEARFSKEEILEIYLNEIFFGNTAYGISAAAKLYFHKDVSEITLAEAAMLAGLPKAPSKYSPLENMDAAVRRQKYVLGQMLEAGFITKAEQEEALKEKVKVYPASPDNIFYAPYFVTELRRILTEDQEGSRWKDLNLKIDNDGLEIHTTLDLAADQMARASLRKGLEEVDKRRGWRGARDSVPQADKQEFIKRYKSSITEDIKPETIYPALVTEVLADRAVARIDLGFVASAIDLKSSEWARKFLSKEDTASWINLEQVIKKGDVIEVSLLDSGDPKAKKENVLPGVEKRFKLDQTPDIEGALVLLDPSSGKVATVQGGYDYTRSKFNRGTRGLRQPGSVFKPIIYLAAIDGYKYTPSTLVYDSPRTFRVGQDFWTPGNFDGKFLGPITLRVALEKSRNIISADIVAGIGVDAVIKYARRMGIKSPLGRNLSISLGSSEVTVLETTRAFGVFAAKGVLFDSVFVDRIVSREGKEIYNYENEKLSSAQRAIDENSAFIMSNMMKGVIESGTGYRIKAIKRPVAGKTGTSNDQMDAWFVGFTPNWACGVWVGFDEKRKIGEKETGGVVSAPIWLYFMQDYLSYRDHKLLRQLEEEGKAEAGRLGIQYVPPEPLEPLDFSVPEGVDPFWVDKASGLLSEPGSPGAIYEYFLKGTEPNKTLAVQEEQAVSYLDSPDL